MRNIIVLILLSMSTILYSGCSTNNSQQIYPLKKIVSKTTTILIRSGGICHNDNKAEKVLIKLNITDSIKSILSNIKIDTSFIDVDKVCCGNPTMEFYKNNKIISSIGLHLGIMLSWHEENVTYVATLNSNSANNLTSWLSDCGIRDPLEYLHKLKAQKSPQEKLEQRISSAAKIIPDTLSKALMDREEFQKRLLAKFNSSHDQINILLTILGLSNNSWSHIDFIDGLANSLLHTYDKEILKITIRKCLLGKDRLKRRGAARFWEGWKSPLENWNPPDVAKLHSIVLTVQQESRYYPLRQSALSNLYMWASELTDDEVSKRINFGLYDSNKSVRRQAMIVAGKMNFKKAIPYLLKVLNNESINTIPLPNVPKIELQDISIGFDDIAGQRSEDQVAALALGYLNYTPVKKIINNKNASYMYDIALALLGEFDYIKPVHFKLEESNQELQLAAIEAVIRCRGKAGLKWAMEYKLNTYWWEPEYVLKELKGMLLENNCPGIKIVEKALSLKDLLNWYEEYGSSYLKVIESK